MRAAIQVLVLSAFVTVPVLAETLNNETVVGLSAAGFGDDVIVAKIVSSEASFDLTTPSLMALKSKGVSSAVITAMINRSAAKDEVAESSTSPDPAIPHPMGLYFLDESASEKKMARIDASGSSQMKVGNTLGYAFSYGIAPITMKILINGDKAHVVSDSRQPIFFMYSASSQRSRGQYNPYAMMANLSFMTLTSPNDFSLIRLVSKSGHREAKVGNFNIAGGQTGVMDKDRVQFQYTQVKDGVFKVTTSTVLEPGEYAFVKGMTAGSSVFDFSVR